MLAVNISKLVRHPAHLRSRHPTKTRHHHARDAVADGYHKESSGSGSRRAPSPMEKALTRREHNFVREQTDDYNHEHDADNLVHGI
jgi:hypothetical protein